MQRALVYSLVTKDRAERYLQCQFHWKLPDSGTGLWNKVGTSNHFAMQRDRASANPDIGLSTVWDDVACYGRQ